MNEPCRMLEEGGSDFERALLEAGCGYRCSPETRDRVVVSLGLVGAVGALTFAGAAILERLASIGRLKLLAGFSFVGVAAAVPLANTWNAQDTEAWLMTAPLSAARVQTAIAALEKEGIAEPAQEVTGGFGHASSKAMRTLESIERASRAAASKKTRPKALGLTEEVRALDQVRARLSAGQAHQALALIGRYHQKHPRGRLALEAEVLRIDALAAVGQGASAKRRAKAFLRKYPKSLLVSRVRRYAAE